VFTVSSFLEEILECSIRKEQKEGSLEKTNLEKVT
jgi:hypothetical protein